MNRVSALILSAAVLLAGCGSAPPTVTTETIATDATTAPVSECTRFAVVDDPGRHLQESVEFAEDIGNLRNSLPSLDWFSEFDDFNLSGHSVDIETYRTELEGIEFELSPIGGAPEVLLTFAGPDDTAGTFAQIARATSQDYTLVWFSQDITVDELVEIASRTRSVCQDEWVEAGGQLDCIPFMGCGENLPTATAAPPTTAPLSPTTTASASPTTDPETGLPLGVTTTHSPGVWIDPADVLIDVPSGRWGHDPLHVTTIDLADNHFEGAVPPEGFSTCDEMSEFLQTIPRHAWATARDEVREHDLDHNAADLGDQAEAVADLFASLPDRCPIFEDGESLTVKRLKIDEYTDAMSLTSEAGETTWFASMHRNNIFTWLVVYETGDDRLLDSDLADFGRLSQLAFDALAQA